MKFPRISVALLLLAGFAWPVEAPSTGAPKAAKTTKGKKPTRAGALKAAAQRKSMDSLRRVDSLRTFDSLFLVQDSLRKDSTLRADSLHRVDSIARAARTWYVTRVRDFAATPAIGRRLQDSLRLELLRNGGIWLGDTAGRDTCGNFECSWRDGLATGSGKLLYTALYRTSDSGWKATAWLFEMASGKKLDSATLVLARADSLRTGSLAREMARRLHPTPTQALCLADSSTQARTLWAFEIPVNHTDDSTMNARLRGLFNEAFAASGRGRALFLKDSVYCPTRGCLDTLAGSLGAHRALQFDISRRPDSTWRLVLVVSNTSPDSLIDSLLVTSPSFDGLVRKAVPLLLPPPASCRAPCEQPAPEAAKLVWSVGSIRSDSTKAASAAALSAELARLFAADARHQYVPSDSTTKPSASWTRRRIDVGLEGSDSLWIFHAAIRDPRTGNATDSLTLARGGYRPRVFAWFARKLLEAVHPVATGCGSPCAQDSARVADGTWFFAPASSELEDKTLAPLLDGHLKDKMAGKGRGKVVALPDSAACRTVACIDSAAADLGARRVLRTTLSRTPDSLWTISAYVTESVTGLALDSTVQTGAGAAGEAFALLSERALAALVPAAPRCDTCVSMDTLEAGLALIEPRWTDVSDTLQNLFVDSLRGALARDGHYQVIPLAATAPLYASSGSSCDSACRQALMCKAGATSMVTSSLSRDGSGWRVGAQLVDLRTGKIVSQMSSLEHRNDAQRLREIAPWVARKLCGADTAAEAPSSRRKLDLPWGKLVALLLPIAAGLVSVISRW